ncbi:MAG: PAS domain S-box protein, partial [Anaerolineae bacterium]
MTNSQTNQDVMWGQSLIENLHDVIYAADADGTVTYVSPAIERLLGYTPAELVGGSLGQTVHDDDLARLEEALQGLLEGETATNEYRILTKSGQVRWIRTSSRPSIQDGRITGVQGVLSDITERKLAEEQLREQNEFLTLVLESLTHPFYVVDAHDYSIHIANSAARAEALGKQATCYALAHHRTEPCSGTDHPCPLQEIKR